jgi:transcriptional regulator with XRE-family HTH domain
MKEEKKKIGRPISSKAPWGELFKIVGQEKIADELGVSKSTVGKWARNIHRVPELAKRELLRLCRHHEVKEGIENFQS